jgi:hypothetical protein
MDWRVLAALTVGGWGAYNIILKAVSGRVAWQRSMLWFVIGYAGTDASQDIRGLGVTAIRHPRNGKMIGGFYEVLGNGQQRRFAANS